MTAPDAKSHRGALPLGPTTPVLDDFRKHYSPRESARPVDPPEAIPIEPGYGLAFLREAPASDVEFGYPPKNSDERGHNTYLWVIDSRGIPYLIESPLSVLDGKLPKHTNLTGGEPAYVGGELWFSGSTCMFVSGGSGRFPPQDEEQLDKAIDIFASFSYTVTSLGWNPETGRARRLLQEL